MNNKSFSRYFLLTLLVSMLGFGKAAAQQAYVVLDGTNLSFYYDSNLNLRTGTKYLLTDTDENGMPAWVTPAGQRDVVSVIFDQSFANYRPTTTKDWFYNLGSLKNINNIGNLNTSQVTDMSYMFSGCEALTTLDLSSFDTRNVQNFSKMFTNCRALVSLNVKGWNTEKATDMFQMFLNCWSLKTLDLGSFSLPNVEKMNMMFMECKTLIALNLNLNNAAKLTQSEYMFFNCKKLSHIYTPNEWMTPALTKSENMFNGCEALQGEKGTTYDESHLDKAYAHLDGGTSNPGYLSVARLEAYANYYSGDLTFCYDCFKDVWTGESYPITNNANQTPAWCSRYKNDIRTATFDMSFADYHPTVTSYWFFECSALEDIYGLEYLNTSEVTTMSFMFYKCESLPSLNLSSFDTRKVRSMRGMFGYCNALTTLNLSKFDTSNVTDMRDMFNNCKSLSNLRIGNFKTGMFCDCQSLTSLDLSHFDTGNVTTMETMFWSCRQLSTLNVSNFNTSKVTSMKMMFCDCPKLQMIRVNNFDTRNVTTMQRMFDGCEKLDYLDLSSFNTAKVTSMSTMFCYGKNLTSIYVGPGWSTENVSESNYMFSGCVKLVGEKGTTYDENHTNHLYARVDGGPSRPGYFTLKHLKGDVNLDGNIDVRDMSATLEAILKGTTALLPSTADVTNDGQVDVRDMSAILNIILGK